MPNGSLCPAFNLSNKISVMQHLAAYKSFAAVTYLLAVCDSIAVDEHLYIVCVKVEVKLYTV